MRVVIYGKRSDVERLLQEQKGWNCGDIAPKDPPVATTIDRVSVELAPALGTVVESGYKALLQLVRTYPTMEIRVR